MTAMLLDSQIDSKDLKVLSKNIKDSEKKDTNDFFEELIQSLVTDANDNKAKNSLLEKLLNLSSNDEDLKSFFEKLSDKDLNNQLIKNSHEKNKQEVSLDEFLNLSFMIKNDVDIKNSFTDSKENKILSDEKFVEDIKNVGSIQDLFKVAKKYDIKIKNFSFSKEDNISLKTDKVTQKHFKSEEVFKIFNIKEKNNTQKLIENIKQDNSHKENTLKNILSTINNKDDKKNISFNESKKNTKEIYISKKEKNIKNFKNDNLKNVNKTDDKNLQEHIDEKLDKNQKVDKNSFSKNIETVKATTLSSKEKIDKTQDKKDSKIKIKNKSLVDSVSFKDLQPNKTSSLQVKQNEQILDHKQTHTQKNNEVNINSKKFVLNSEENKQKDIDKNDENLHKNHESVKVEHSNNIVKNEHTKIKNADVKHTLNTFAQDFKEQVESYKPPLMKVKMQLNPKGLGEVDVTMVNRGNNLHITVNSNPNTIAIFSQNQTEFKNSLVNMGFSELNMSFNENGKNKDGNQNQKNKNNSFESFEEEQVQDSFEIVTPIYI